MAKILTMQDKPLGPRKKPKAKMLREWEKKNEHFRRMLKESDAGDVDWKLILNPPPFVEPEPCYYSPADRIQNSIFSAMRCGLAAFRLFR